MNISWIVTLVRNGRAMTEAAIRSFLAQDIPVNVLIINNNARDGAAEYVRSIQDRRVWVLNFAPARGVSKSWNTALTWLFTTGDPAWTLEPRGAEEAVLVCNNDTVIRTDCYRRLLEDGGGFVTGVGNSDPGCVRFLSIPDPATRRPHPDMSCFLIRRETWETVGPFDETMVNYCSDGDYHLRMHQAGIDAHCLDLPFYHVASGTLKNMDEAERERLMIQADRDRAAFAEKWGFRMGSSSYYDAFGGSRPDDPGAASDV